MTNKNAKRSGKSSDRQLSDSKLERSVSSSSPTEDTSLTVEDIEEKIQELRKLQKQIDPSYKPDEKVGVTIFQIAYISLEIILSLGILGLALYVYYTNQRNQAMYKEAMKIAEDKIKMAGLNDLVQAHEQAAAPPPTYDTDEFCLNNDCDDVVSDNNQHLQDEDELDFFLND